MDQLKQFIAVVKKQHFWILCGLVVLIGLVMYSVAGSKMAATYSQSKSKISTVSDGLGGLIHGEHPNREWAEQVQKKTDDLRNNVRDAWEALYNSQKQRVFVWPPALGTDFISAFNASRRRIPIRGRWSSYCERYQGFVKTELRHLGQVVDADWVKEGEDTPRHRPGMRVPAGPETESTADPQKIFTVNWDAEDQNRLMLAYDWQDAPSPLDVRYAQEEVWVMDAICHAIARTNTGARGPYEAVVRDINKMLIGYDAVDKYPLGEGGKRLRHIGRIVPAAAATAQPIPGGDPRMMAGGPLEAPKRPVRHKNGAGGDDEGPRGGMSHFQRGPGGIPGDAARHEWPASPRRCANAGSAAAAGGGRRRSRFLAERQSLCRRPTVIRCWPRICRNPPVAEYNSDGVPAWISSSTKSAGRNCWSNCATRRCPLEVREVRINVYGR